MLEKNIKIIEDRIAEKCLKSGREREEITLIGVSKLHPASAVLEANKCGIINFGENKAQELRDKADEINKPVIWHFIGHLQTNKVKYVAKSAEYIHSVDSVKLADEIQKRAEKLNKVQKVLLEIKTSDEATKFGLTEEKEILNLVDYLNELKNVQPVGLMTMAPYTEDKAVIRDCFGSLCKLKNNLHSRGYKLEHLSMGMTNDFEIAIEEGATMIRIGTAIFGERNY